MEGQPMREMGKSIDQATATVRDAGEQAWSAATGAAAEAQALAQKARGRTAAAGDAVYRQGAQVGEYLTRNVNQYPLTALLIAGGVGYLTAHLLHAGRSASRASATER